MIQLSTFKYSCCNIALGEQQEWNADLDLDETNPPSIKEEDEDLWPAQEQDTPPGSEKNDKFSLFQSGILRSKLDHDHMTSTLCKFQSQDLENSEHDPQLGTSVQHISPDLDQDPLEASDPASGNGQVDCGDLDPPGLSEAVDSYICTICGRAFVQRGHWAKHMQVHRKVEAKTDKSYTCDICGKRLTRFDGYQKHLRIHTGEKPYSCGECGRRFSDNSNYKRHIRTHMGTKTKSLEAQEGKRCFFDNSAAAILD
ncbi:uncharacterized protein ACBR49_017586 isoform 2-T2 [Aulostomus maculatus]